MRTITASKARCIYCNGTGEQVQRVRFSDQTPTGRRVSCWHCQGTGGGAPTRGASIGEFIGVRVSFGVRYLLWLVFLYLVFAGGEWLYRWLS